MVDQALEGLKIHIYKGKIESAAEIMERPFFAIWHNSEMPTEEEINLLIAISKRLHDLCSQSEAADQKKITFLMVEKTKGEWRAWTRWNDAKEGKIFFSLKDIFRMVCV